MLEQTLISQYIDNIIEKRYQKRTTKVLNIFKDYVELEFKVELDKEFLKRENFSMTVITDFIDFVQNKKEWKSLFTISNAFKTYRKFFKWILETDPDPQIQANLNLFVESITKNMPKKKDLENLKEKKKRKREDQVKESEKKMKIQKELESEKEEKEDENKIHPDPKIESINLESINLKQEFINFYFDNLIKFGDEGEYEFVLIHKETNRIFELN